MLRKILIDTRDHAYHYAKKQNGIEAAKSDYMFKMFGVLSFYYVGVLMLFAHLVSLFFAFQQFKHLSLFIRFLIGVIIAVIPIWFLVKGALSIVKDTHIPEEISRSEYNRKRYVALSVLILGIIFFLMCAVLPVYFSGGTIHIGNYVIQRK